MRNRGEKNLPLMQRILSTHLAAGADEDSQMLGLGESGSPLLFGSTTMLKDHPKTTNALTYLRIATPFAERPIALKTPYSIQETSGGSSSCATIALGARFTGPAEHRRFALPDDLSRVAELPPRSREALG